ncbi:hypothetical protein PUN28_001965 [Cardiocondyla obscurior]|uniref:Uncharacterized protein n=1 Tax=Cardiocondyla obscurior TaxID=286306 RepID=A0AAW2GS52_9HYME
MYKINYNITCIAPSMHCQLKIDLTLDKHYNFNLKKKVPVDLDWKDLPPLTYILRRYTTTKKHVDVFSHFRVSTMVCQCKCMQQISFDRSWVFQVVSYACTIIWIACW